MQIQEGYVPFGKYQTYYRIVGNESKKPPLLLLHGGPGSTHNYFEVLDDLAAQDQRQIIMYDQVGCGKSSDLADPNDYNQETWVKELINLREYLHLDQLHLLGQSWGGMLAIIYCCDYHPQGLKSVILASTLSSARLWSSEQHRLIKQLPAAEQAAIARAEQTGDYHTKDYLAANHHYMQLHAQADPTSSSPECLRRPKRVGTVAYETAWGPNEYTPIGNLRDYEYTDQLEQLTVPALITDGTNDLCTPLVAKTMYDHIPNAKWQLFQGCRHMVFTERLKEYQQLLISWLNQHD
ncbi:proline iminopeptidase [Limosilactobacillus caecicola]|uniref:proline iminopeptidase n=1 Tax=Limosilactobacillus caecicola TaxID=2941332 RepID=UPI0020403D9A|nr:proline iminopeptidase-family hydrolase [Limosilactobacillus caecicola]